MSHEYPDPVVTHSIGGFSYNGHSVGKYASVTAAYVRGYMRACKRWESEEIKEYATRMIETTEGPVRKVWQYVLNEKEESK